MLHSERLSLRLKKLRAGPTTLDGFWNGYKTIQEKPVEFILWQRLKRIELPDCGPVILRLDRNNG
jgi:hypothetical protein